MSDTSVKTPEFVEAETASAWKAKAGHPVTLPSGTIVRVRVPNLAALAKTGQLPNELVKLAVPEIAGSEAAPLSEEEAADAIRKLADFQSWIVTTAVVTPTIDEDDVPELPTEDVEMIVAIATRQRDLDAVGHHIGGLEASAEFRRFRNLPAGDEDLLD